MNKYAQRFKTPEQRFWEKVDKSGGDDACWAWLAGSIRGYGYFFLGGKSVKAYRFSWALANGAVPHGLCVCHHCDNPTCVNPGHLFLGTFADNNADKLAKRRHSHGENHPCAKLTDADVSDIRAALGLPRCNQTRIAERFGVSSGMISHIATNRNWTHSSSEPGSN